MHLIFHDYGGYAFTLQLAKHLAEQGHQVDYLHGGEMQLVRRADFETQNNNLRVAGMILTQPFAKYSLVQRWHKERVYGYWLADQAEKSKPDIIISANAPLDTQHLLARYSSKNNISFVFWWQDVVGLGTKKILSQKNTMLGKLVGSHYQNMERRLLKQSQRVIAIAEEFRPLYRGWGLDESKFHVLPNWAPIEEIPTLPKDNSWSHSHGLHDKFVFLYSGILGMKHNPQVFITLAKHFRNNKEVVIVVVSDGKGADWLREQKKHLSLDNIQVHPFQPYEDYPKVLASADVLLAVLDAQAGNYSVPSKVLSYFCAGRPQLLAIPLDNLAAKIVQSSRAGYVVHPADITEMMAKAEQLFSNQLVRQEFARNARRYAEENFDIGKIGSQFLDLINKTT